MDVRLCKSLSVYYGTQGLYQTMFELTKRGKAEHPSKEAEFKLISCCALKLLGRADEAKKESETIYIPEEVDAFRYFCRETSSLDQNDSSILVLLLMGEHKRCGELRLVQQSLSALCHQGWSHLHLRTLDKAQDCFEKALKLSPSDFEANLGMAKHYEAKEELDKALDVLNRLIIKHPDSAVPIVEKMGLHLSLCDWEQAIEQAGRVQSSVEAAKVRVLKALCLDGNFEEAEHEIGSLRRVLEEKENFNPWAYFSCAQLITRVCSRNVAILQEVKSLMQKAIEMQPASCEFHCELGYVLQLQGKLKDAIKELKTAVKLDDSSIFALSNLTLCQLLENRSSDTVKQQIELLKELQGADPSPQLLYMSAILNEKDRQLPLKAIQAHLRKVEGMSFGPAYLRNYDPEFIFSIIGTLLNRMHMKKDSPELMYLLKILKPITQTCPGLSEAKFLHAKALHLSGDSTGALAQLRRYDDSSEAQLLVAKILLSQNDVNGANSALETALSFDFTVKEHPLYLLVQGKNQRGKKSYAEAIKWLKTGLASQGLASSDKVSISLELAETLNEAGRGDEAADLLRKTVAEFSGTSEEGRLITAQADLALEANRVDQALEILNSIGPSEMHYLEARHKMAEIYLVHKKDRRKFAACYLSIVEQKPGVDSQILLGDAYMRVHEPEKAVEIYEQVMKSTSRKDPSLARKVGQALVKTHMYGKAVNFYIEQAKKLPSLRKDLVELLIRLKNFDKAESILKIACAGTASSSDSNELIDRCQLLLLLAKVQEQQGNSTGALKSLTDAKEMQSKVLKRLHHDGTGKLAKQKIVAADICRMTAEHASGQNHTQDAVKFYKEALAHQPNDPDTLISLAKLYLHVDELAQCQSTCGQLLRTEPENEAACVMMADISFRKTDFETASVHFQQLLSKQPRYWTALARFVEVMRRAGTLSQVPPYLERAAAKGDEPGLAYCQGLYSCYNGDTNQALKHFNRARRDPEWGRQAICSMIEICLNNDSMATLENTDVDSRDSRETALKTAEKLLAELNPRPVSEEKNMYQLLVCFWMLAKRDKAIAEQALQELTILAGQENSRISIGVTLAISQAYLILKQSTRARNQLKRVAKHPWTFEEAEYLEKCWLLLGELYIQSGKYDSASELLNKVLVHNKSCTKAFESLGLIHEKEQQYKDAAIKYEQAWTFGNKTNPAVGYKMAYNLLKSKKYTTTIDVCHQVLANFPNYPNIQKDILDKARGHLRN